jgi:hypothetical protein
VDIDLVFRSSFVHGNQALLPFGQLRLGFVRLRDCTGMCLKL